MRIVGPELLQTAECEASALQCIKLDVAGS